MRWRKLSMILIIWPFTVLNGAAFPRFPCKGNVLAPDPLDARVDCVGWMQLPHLTEVWMDLKEQWEESTWENAYSFVERQLKASIRKAYLCTFVVSSVHHCSLWVCPCVSSDPRCFVGVTVCVCVRTYSMCVSYASVCICIKYCALRWFPCKQPRLFRTKGDSWTVSPEHHHESKWIKRPVKSYDLWIYYWTNLYSVHRVYCEISLWKLWATGDSSQTEAWKESIKMEVHWSISKRQNQEILINNFTPGLKLNDRIYLKESRTSAEHVW